MKILMLLCTAFLVLAFLPCHDCRALQSSAPATSGQELKSRLQQPGLPLWLRVGEEYLLRLGKTYRDPPAFAPDHGVSLTQLTQLKRALQDKVGDLDEVESRYQGEGDEMMMIERGKRLEEPPISLDLTFHLLREVLEMTRAEQLAQQAHSNRKIMELIGK
ncbi:corticoliberin [Callorhinchus milii]|uniref:Corticoliberin n=1 Tax=Callorhinchus milii TaxID=7868 RepID=V9L601_CALMI|nr:corticoliberin [Callorhinchus milii]|eukprot:gi/632958267/ref/XP_007894939.1/ PREDICTED: corticoliberin [Callorhinchus milii]